MILIGTADGFPTQQDWLDCIADWHQFCLDKGLNPWEHLITKELSFYVSSELYSLRPVLQSVT